MCCEKCAATPLPPVLHPTRAHRKVLPSLSPHPDTRLTRTMRSPLYSPTPFLLTSLAEWRSGIVPDLQPEDRPEVVVKKPAPRPGAMLRAAAQVRGRNSVCV